MLDWWVTKSLWLRGGFDPFEIKFGIIISGYEGASIPSICDLSSFYWNGFLRDLAASQALRWPDRGIYVDDENEIDGLKQLLYGRDERISPESCLGSVGYSDVRTPCK
ncbi:hypothetical protein L1987_79206 [Smallanthus sonchifolius]|uniref:Uncharacterized protein n=1 Tax=Smallanthus sonchifolius TaxID=185202 RepID=A0ACB8ZFD3_9ASTR|nr:hypothetical protein L1987_79206 [Smallanthus sonchifolius]